MKQKKPKKGKDGLFHARKYIGKYADGTRCYERFSDTSWDNLLLSVAERRIAFANGENAVPHLEKEAPVMTLIVAMEKYIDTCRTMQEAEGEYSVSTIAAYASICRSVDSNPIFNEVAHCRIEHVTVDKLQTAFDTAVREKKLSVKSLRNWWGLIKPALDKYGPDIRLDKVKIAKGKTKKAMVIREADIPLVLAEARKIGDDFFLYVLFSAVLGARPSESYALTWADVSAEKQTSIVGGKVHEYGEIFIDKACVCDEFGKYREKTTKTEAGTRTLSRPWSFFEMLYSVRPRGNDGDRIIQMIPGAAPYRWNKLKQRIDLPDDMVMYDLRHYHATVMRACGAPDTYIASDMGHSDITTTHRHYFESIEEKKQEINAAVYEHEDNLLKVIFL